jgi:hypothetical protein
MKYCLVVGKVTSVLSQKLLLKLQCGTIPSICYLIHLCLHAKGTVSYIVLCTLSVISLNND